MYPLRFEPIYRDYVWGGDRIAKKYHKNQQGRIAESWELADRPDAISVVANGPYQGKSLHELMQEMKEDLLGQDQHWERFPLLCKIIDARENLSVQVHPDEQTAPSLQGESKSEMWYLLEDGSVYAGLQEAVTQEQFFESISEQRADQLLKRLDLKKGAAVYIPGGRIHAICSGTFLFEVQQNSDTTYRLYDWGRSARKLHLQEGAAAAHWQDRGGAQLDFQRLESDLHHQIMTVLSCPYFIVERVDVFDLLHLGAIAKTFQIFFCLDGEGHIEVDGVKEPLMMGMTYLVPAVCHGVNFSGKLQLLRIRLP